MVCRAFWGERSDWSSPFEPAAVICDKSRGKLANDMDVDDEVGVEEGLACCVLGNEVALCLLPPGKQRCGGAGVEGGGAWCTGRFMLDAWGWAGWW